MDGDPVTEGTPSREYSSLTEVFITMCPYYMEMGMTYYEYWHMNTSVHKAYRDAYEIRRRNDEWARHRLGAYFMKALTVGLSGFNKDKSKHDTYPDQPWPMTQKEVDEREEENYRLYIAKMRAASDRELRRREEEKEAIKDGDD